MLFPFWVFFRPKPVLFFVAMYALRGLLILALCSTVGFFAYYVYRFGVILFS